MTPNKIAGFPEKTGNLPFTATDHQKSSHEKQQKVAFLFPRHVLRRVAWLLLLLCLLPLANETKAQSPSNAIGVYYDGPIDNRNVVYHAIRLARPYVILVDQPELAQVVVINGQAPSEQTLRLNNQVQQGVVGLLVFSAQPFPGTAQDLRSLLGISTFELARLETPVRIQVGDQPDVLHPAVAWNSAPELRARTVISNPNLLLPVVTTSSGEATIQRVRGRETTQIVFVSAWLNHPQNSEWPTWPYFYYLVYRLIADAAAASRIVPYADYALSPVPHGWMQRGLISGGIGLVLLVVALFYSIQHYLYLNPEAMSQLRIPDHPIPENNWHTVGFHRQLAGLLCLLPVSLLLLPMMAWYRVHLLPQILIPWTMPRQFWAQIAQALNIVWVLFDMGTGIAVVYYFALLKITHPYEAFRYFKFYVWWQFLSGALQLGLAAILTAELFPHTSLAHLAYYFLLHALIQFPGFLRGWGFFFRAIQRFDYEHILHIVVTWGGLALQSLCILWLRQWGATLPAVGEGLGCIIGLELGLVLTEWLGFIVGGVLYMRMGYTWQAVFLPQFNRQIILNVLSFGGRVTFGNVLVMVGGLAQASLLVELLPNYAQAQTNLILLSALLSAFEILGRGLYDSLLPALIEALRLKYETLLRYYVGQGLHYGLWFSLFFVSVLTPLLPRVIPAIFGEFYMIAAQWSFFLLVWGAVQWLSTLAERMLQATERPAIVSWLNSGEILIRLILLWLLVPRWQFLGIGLAFALGWLLKVVTLWMLAKRWVVQPHITRWPSLVAPGLAALMLYSGVYLWTEMLIPQFPVFEFALLTLVPPLGLPIYSFLTALLGGWDDAGIAEFRQAMWMSSLSFPVAWLMWVGLVGGATLSPLHGRFPMTLRPLAAREAQSLTLSRVQD